PALSIWGARPMDALIAQPLAQPRISALLLSAFALAALGLAALGLYGVMASLVRDQTREIGVRMALGASPERVRRSYLWSALRVTGIGAATGLVVALFASRLVTRLLYEVRATDPLTLSAACLLLIGTAIAAAYLPARRATRIDPARALRAD